MHRCLETPEIVREICYALCYNLSDLWHCRAKASQPKPERQALANLERRALANLSRTCHRFYQPATEELWSIMGPEFGLNPLLDAMGDNLWVLTQSREGQRKRVSILSMPCPMGSLTWASTETPAQDQRGRYTQPHPVRISCSVPLRRSAPWHMARHCSGLVGGQQ